MFINTLYSYHSDVRKVLGVFLRSLSSAELCATPEIFGWACLATKISPGPHRAQMASQLGLSRLAVCYRRICDGRPVSEGELYPWTDWYETSRMDALTAAWPVAGENHRNEAAGTAEGDLCESQETVGGMLLVQQRWVVVEICFTLNLGSLFLLNTILAILVILHPQLTRMLQHFH